jgi:CDP-diglyceride synthetase
LVSLREGVHILQDRDERPETYSIDSIEESDLSDLGEPLAGPEPAPDSVEGATPAAGSAAVASTEPDDPAELAQVAIELDEPIIEITEPETEPAPAAPLIPAQRPPRARARIEGIAAGVAAGLVPAAPSNPELIDHVGADAAAHSDEREGGDDDRLAGEHGVGSWGTSQLVTATSPALPDWRDPPTREVPRVLQDHPLADRGPAYPGPVWREVESDWDHDDRTFAEIVSEGTSVAEHGLGLDEPDPFSFDFEIGRSGGASSSGVGPLSAWAVEPDWDPPPDDSDDEPARASGSIADPISAGMPLPPEPTTGQPEAKAPTHELSGAMHRARVTFAGRVRRVDRPTAPPADTSGSGAAKPRTWTRVAGRRSVEPAPEIPVPAHTPAPPPTAAARRNPAIATATGLAFGLFVLLCFFVGPPLVLALVTVVLVVSTAECYQALRRARYQPAVLLGLLAVVALAVAGYYKGLQAFPIVAAAYVFATICWYLFGLTRRSPVANIGASVVAWLWIGMLGGFGVLLLDPTEFPHRHGLAYLLGAIVATVAYDVGGYAFGSWIGNHPLAPRISPNKTWEGLIGGCVAAVAISLAVTSHMAPWTVPHAFELGIVVSVFAPLGDLAESMVKRDLRVKDMGTLLPAHGGLLDRVDGLLFVLPATYMLVRLFHG